MKSLHSTEKVFFKKAMNYSRGIWKHNFNELFGDRKRIEVPLETGVGAEDSNAYKLVSNYLRTHGNYKMTDYVGGYCQRSDDKNVYKIGKIIAENEYISEHFRECPFRQKVKLVISRHPYDIACASWGQDWDSCLNFEDGMSGEELENSISSNMLLIAYTVPISKKGNKKPLGRVLVVPYINRKTGLFHLYPAVTTYGIFHDKYREDLIKWLDDNYNNRMTHKFGEDLSYKFEFPSHAVYDNDDRDTIIVSNPIILTNRKFVRKSINQGNLCKMLSNLGHTTVGSINNSSGTNMVECELDIYMEYHKLYGGIASSRIYRNNQMSQMFMSKAEPIDPDHVNEYINFLIRNKLQVDRLVSYEKIIAADYKIGFFKKYVQVIDNPIVWDEGCDMVKDLVESKLLSVNSKLYKDVTLKILRGDK
jgi:hypothetical protein